MRTDLQILRAAIGDDSLTAAERLKDKEVGRLRFYRLQLPLPRFRGLPPVWHFAVASRPEQPLGKQEREAFLEEARELIRKSDQPTNRTVAPLVLVCDDPAVRLNDKLRFDRKNIFFVDEHMLPSGKDFPRHPRAAPFIVAVRSKLDPLDLSTLLFEPYVPESPASGWRFFGRRRELDRLLHSDENIFVVGSRKIGKTSLLNEVKDRLIEKGEEVYKPNVQFLSSSDKVVEAIIQALSARDASAAVRRSKALNEELLASILKSLSARRGRVTLILDELGNIIFHSRKADWRVFGTLREFSHSGKLRVIMSGFQEFFIKQRDDFTSPFVNFAGVMRLGCFDESEVEEFLVDPLRIWGRVDDGRALLRLVTAEVGRHPYFLQYLGQAVFRAMFERRPLDAQSVVEDLMHGTLDRFHAPIDSLFMRIRSAAVRYIFLKCCHETAARRLPVHQAELTDEWVEGALTELGQASTVSGRSFLLDELEMRGLTVRANATGSRQRVAVPIIYSFMNKSEGIQRYLAALARDVVHEKRELLYGGLEETEGDA